MAENADPNTFEELVKWAYSTLPQKIRRLPDFPGRGIGGHIDQREMASWN